MEKHNLDLQKTELRQILLKTNKQDLSQDKVNASGEKTVIKTVDLKELINWQQIEEVSSDDNAQLMLGNVPANQSGLHSVTGQIGVLSIDQLQPIDRSQMVVVNVTGQDYYSDESILEQKINSLGFNVSAIRSYLDKKVSSFSREEIFEMFEKIRPQLRSFVGQKLYNAGIDFNWEFIDDVLDRILSQWEYSNNAIGGPNQKRDFKFTKVIDLLQTIRNRINLAVSYGIKGDDHYYTSDEILEGSFYGSYKTLMYNLLYTDDRYLNPEEKELKAALNDYISGDIVMSRSDYENKIVTCMELFKNYLKSKFGYSDNFIESVLCFAEDNTKYIKDTDTVLFSFKEFSTNVFKLIQVPKMDRNGADFVTAEESSTGEAYWEEYDINLFDEYPNDLYAENFLNFFLKSRSTSEPQTVFLASELRGIINDLGLEGYESRALMRIIFKRIAEKLGIERDKYGHVNLSKADFEKLNYDILIKADCSWIDEVFDIIHEEASKIRHMDQSEWEAATSINYDELFKLGDLNAESFEENFDEMLLSNDPGVRKLAHMIEDALKNENCYTVKEKQNYIKWLIVLMNKENGIQYPDNGDEYEYTQESLNKSKLNDYEKSIYFSKTENGTYIMKTSVVDKQFPNMHIRSIGYLERALAYAQPGTDNIYLIPSELSELDDNVFDKIEEIQNSQKLRNCIKADVNGIIEDFNQHGGMGNTNDCWLLSGALAIASTPIGSQMMRNCIRWNEDYTAVIVTYPSHPDNPVEIPVEVLFYADREVGNTYYYTHTGDNDVIALALAYEAIFGESVSVGGDDIWETIEDVASRLLSKDMKYANSFLEDFLPNGTQVYDKRASVLEALTSLLGLSDRTVEMDDSDVIGYLQRILQAKKQGLNVAATFAIMSTGYYTYRCNTVDGGEPWSLKFDGGAHVMAIVDITPTTVTFIDPNDEEGSGKKYTVTWSQFASIGIAELSWATFSI